MPTPRPLLWNDLQIFGISRLGVNAPTLSLYRGGIYGLEFSATATNELHGAGEGSHEYAEGLDMVAHVHFRTNSTSAAGGGVRMGIEYILCNAEDGSVESDPATLLATKTIPAVNSQYKQFSLDLGTVPGAGLRCSFNIMYRIFRLGGDPADTFPATIFPQSFALHYRSDSDGSTAQNTKY